MPVEFSIWRFSNWAGVVPPVNPADITDNCNLTPGRREWTQSGGGVSYIIVSQALDIRFSEDLAFTVGAGSTTGRGVVARRRHRLLARRRINHTLGVTGLDRCMTPGDVARRQNTS
jgi:hypothetical protein